MLWLNFLHFYQPANTEYYKIKIALERSYWRLLRLMEEHPNLHFTCNISGCLLDRLVSEGQKSFIKRLQPLIKNGQIELTSSAAYHGFLPLLPDKEVIYQIKQNEQILKKYFGKNFKPSGFFLPEMAYSSRVAKIIKKLGYSWIILDEISYKNKNNLQLKNGQFYLDRASGLRVIFRNRKLSRSYPPNELLLDAKKLTVNNSSKVSFSNNILEKKIYLTATDAELYGLNYEDPTGELEKLVKFSGLKTLTISNYWQLVAEKKLEKIDLYNSSWESSLEEIKNKQPYKLWFDKDNKIQVDLWKLANLALNLGDKFKDDENFYWYHWHLVRGLASCTFWWASARDFSEVYGPYAWNPDDIERGLEDLIRSVRSFGDLRSKKSKLLAEKYYLQIKKHIWEEHWNKHWSRITQIAKKS
jgi:hypothetical protein